MCLRIKLDERQVLELVLDFTRADAFGEGREDVHRLVRDAPALGLVFDEVQRTHVVQTVGQFD